MEKNYELLFIVIMLLFATAIILRPLLRQGKSMLKLLVFAGVGLASLVFLNLFGHFFNMYLPINYVTVLVSGGLGLPGVILLTALKFILM
ncbi:pro-sigmaK processing inhibitor BofA family protein [Proteinivorax hydrogeniformans]|uniref:Pro-sigmaK processing inhibitor BofA family protein n=1 Tax=Proteinivorax hydrogeniformans TaxID=1826727 RepID=A0AAU8HTF3_9FIRM